MAIEDDHDDVLQNIELIVANQYRLHPEMTDYEVLRTYEVLVQVYSAEATGRTPKPISLSGTEADLFRDIKGICEWRLGREAELSTNGGALPDVAITVETIVRCFKRLLVSVKRLNKANGQRGYLSFMTQFLR